MYTKTKCIHFRKNTLFGCKMYLIVEKIRIKPFNALTFSALWKRLEKTTFTSTSCVDAHCIIIWTCLVVVAGITETWNCNTNYTLFKGKLNNCFELFYRITVAVCAFNFVIRLFRWIVQIKLRCKVTQF